MIPIIFSLLAAQDKLDLSRHVYPLSAAIASPRISVDATDYPEGAAWGEEARKLAERWFPTLTTLLSTAEYKPPAEIKLIIKKEIGPPAFASGGSITINGKWITAHPEDLGMVIHELTHVIQSYPRNKANTGWLVEGIADYVRWWRYEPELMATPGRTRIDPEKSKYTDAYRTTAYFLAWASRKYHMGLVPALDAVLRKGEDPMPVFERMTGKDADKLWQEFVADTQK
jgi:hypothetical protein